MRKATFKLMLAFLATLALFATACSGSDSESGGDSNNADSGSDSAMTIAVPADQPTIQDAVDAAKPGALILISPGVYNEDVDVTTDDLTLRGLDRNTVILDGQFKLENGVRILEANGVVVENMTARNFTSNGFYWTGVEGYRGSYLTAYRNGDYGIYAFDAVNGQLDNSLGSGSPDAGFYIGECYPCNALIDNVISENNGLGYSGTNSGGDLYIVNSTFRNNRAGVVPNSGSYELCYPERDTTVVGNLVYENNNEVAPA
ncbi:MAG: right-handed parallel beta-helix repeat-containing protein, partial [Actinobacteria bacterium]|nr:right-handed parallel beta-helix repeat-containing protein [Actinomycetota bacterium]